LARHITVAFGTTNRFHKRQLKPRELVTALR